jgi:hypothetical protein
MKTKRVPAKVRRLMLSIEDEHDRRTASAKRHIRATAKSTASGGSRERLSIMATGKAIEAVLWLDAGFVGTPDYMGLSWFWNYEYRHSLRDASASVRQRIHAAFLKAGLPPDGASSEHGEIVRKFTTKEPRT